MIYHEIKMFNDRWGKETTYIRQTSIEYKPLSMADCEQRPGKFSTH